jgi:hypothetical protein
VRGTDIEEEGAVAVVQWQEDTATAKEEELTPPPPYRSQKTDL